MNEGKSSQKGKASEVIKTYPVPFSLEGSKEEITINNNSVRLAHEKIFKQAFSLHSKGKLLEALKYYEFLIKNNFHDHRVFINHGIILKDLGRLKQAKISTLNAIKIFTFFSIYQ